MKTKRTVQVTNSSGVTWTVRFLSIDAAWARVTGLIGMHDTPEGRKWLRDKGWKVEELSDG